MKQTISVKLTFFLLMIFFLCVFETNAQNISSVCITKFDAPTSGEKSLGNPTGGDSSHIYKIQIGNKSVSGSYERSTKITGLSLNKQHIVKIHEDGKLIESFKFSFKQFSSSKLCLYLKDLYKTWQLQEVKKSPWCNCN